MSHYVRYYPNRTLCSVLEDMRSCYKSLNFGALQGLIEEAQALGNRMEAALGDKRDIEELREERSKLKKEVHALRAQIPKKEKEDAS